MFLGGDPSPNLYHGEYYIEARNQEAEIVIGERVFINNNATIIADKSSIQIGDDTLIGPNFTCFDSNFHPLGPNKRLSSDYQYKPVTIGENFHWGKCDDLARVTVGDNSVVGAGIVLRESIPSNVIVSVSGGLKFIPMLQVL